MSNYKVVKVIGWNDVPRWYVERKFWYWFESFRVGRNDTMWYSMIYSPEVFRTEEEARLYMEARKIRDKKRSTFSIFNFHSLLK